MMDNKSMLKHDNISNNKKKQLKGKFLKHFLSNSSIPTTVKQNVSCTANSLTSACWTHVGIIEIVPTLIKEVLSTSSVVTTTQASVVLTHSEEIIHLRDSFCA